MEPKVDPEFEALIPPLREAELAQLEASILANGCTDSLLTWEGVLVDGHNRLRICRTHKLPFDVREISIASRDDAKAWICQRQLARRNLHGMDRVRVVRLRRSAVEKAAEVRMLAGLKRGGQLAENLSNPTPIPAPLNLAEGDRETRNVLAKEAGCSRDTFARWEVVLDRGVPELQAAVRELDLSAVQASEIALLPPAKQRKEVAAMTDETEQDKRPYRARYTGKFEWYTPEEELKLVKAVLGRIDLDPASSPIAQERVKARRFFTIEEDGLTQEWSGVVFLNPPYSHPGIMQFAEKMSAEWESGRIKAAIMLTNNATDTQWFHKLVKQCAALAFTSGRVGFVDADGKPTAPTNGQTFFYFGSEAQRFTEVFHDRGFVVKPA